MEDREIDMSVGEQAASEDALDEVRAAWVSVLGDDNFDDDEGFFEVGGNSMLVVELHETLITKFPDSGLRLLDLFSLPTVAAQASRLVPGGSSVR